MHFKVSTIATMIKFDSLAGHSACKTRRSISSLCILVDDRKGISARLGIELYKRLLVRLYLEFSVSELIEHDLRLRQHNIGYTADGFYRSVDQTNSVKALKEGG